MFRVGTIIAAIAGVSSEWLLKGQPHSFYLSNRFLYLFGMLFNVVLLVARDGTAVWEQGPFHHFSLFTWCIVFFQSLIGLTVAGGCSCCRLFLPFSLTPSPCVPTHRPPYARMAAAATMKYASNMQVVFGHVLALQIIVGISWLLFNVPVTVNLVCGGVVCSVATIIYHSKPKELFNKETLADLNANED